jgi:hypothetical protein
VCVISAGDVLLSVPVYCTDCLVPAGDDLPVIQSFLLPNTVGRQSIWTHPGRRNEYGVQYDANMTREGGTTHGWDCFLASIV